MAVEMRRKRLQYRKAVFLKSKGDLEHLVSSALRKLHMVADRQQELGEQDRRLINGHARRLQMEFGDLITYELGANKLLVALDTQVPSLNVKQIAPPVTEVGKRNEFLDSILYYGILDNHVVMLQSQPWMSRTFENHLNWLLATAAVLDPADRVELSDIPKPEVRRRAERQDVKAISLSAPVVEYEARAAQSSGATRKHEREVVVPERKLGADVIRAVLGDDEFKRLRLDEAVGGNLRVDLRITFERSTTDAGQRVLNSLARAFRHVDFEPKDFELDVPGVGKIRGNELKLSESVSVEIVNGQPVPDSLFPQMHAWLKELIQNGFVEHG